MRGSVGLGLAGAMALPRLGWAQDALKPDSWDIITSYNNFYEFGTDKGDPKANAHTLRPRPWSIAVEGEVKKPAVYAFDDFFKGMTPEERIYRHRCVEGWSMVAPWLGYPLRDVIKRLEPGSKAKYVEFVTLLDPVQMPGQRRGVLDWPYVEGLRMDEAMHPLTLLTVGIYGLIGFWLYSVALDRTPVSAASAPLIVTQTFVPSLIGVVLLGDGVRPGWWPGVLAGLMLSTLGAVLLSGDGIESIDSPVTTARDPEAPQAS